MIRRHDLLNDAFFARLEHLELRARTIVEGGLPGRHRSPFIGYSAEFASHREYVPGDDLRFVNWRLYARQRRLQIKEFDAETNLNLHILLDISRSMECATSGVSKLQYGAALAVALAHLALQRRDAVGITLFADGVHAHLPPSARPHRLEEIEWLLAATAERPRSDLRKSLIPAAELTKRGGIVILISDLFDDFDTFLEAIDELRFRRHEVVVFQILDPLERDLDVQGGVKFCDLETGDALTARVEGIRDDYLRLCGAWRSELELACRERGVDRVELTTLDPLDEAVVSYLVARETT